MRSVRWNRFPFKQNANRFKPVAFVETSYLGHNIEQVDKIDPCNDWVTGKVGSDLEHVSLTDLSECFESKQKPKQAET